MTNEKKIKTRLDPSHEIDRDVIIVANAGSGKTTLMVEHYFYLLAKGYSPIQVLTFTFTEKAAQELRERIQNKFNAETSQVPENLYRVYRRQMDSALIGTIHQFCLRVLQNTTGSQQVKNYQIVEEATEQNLRETFITEVLKEALQKQNPSALFLLKQFGAQRFQKLIREYLSLPKFEEPVATDSFPDLLDLEIEIQKALKALTDEIFTKIKAEKFKKSWLSFEDLETQALEALRHPNGSLLKFLNRISHILVDEFQDTSPAQIAILEALKNKAGQKPKLFLVGDPKQSIYRFRQVDRLLLEKTEAKIIASGGLRWNSVMNYRSTPEVLELVNHFSQKAFPDALPSEAHLSSTPMAKAQLVYLGQTQEKINAEQYRTLEAKWLCQKVLAFNQEGILPKDIAVLFRSSSSIKTLLEQFKKINIPYSIRGGKNLFQQQECYDLKNLLYFFANPEDDLALLAVLRSPMVLVSDEFLFQVTKNSSPLSLFQKLKALVQNKPLDCLKDSPKAGWFLEHLERYHKQAPYLPASTLLKKWVNEFQLGPLYAQAYDREDPWLNMEQWLDWLEKIEVENFPMSLSETVQFLQKLERNPIQKTPLANLISSESSLSCLSIHASKGLQFRVVFLVGLIHQAPPSTQLIQRFGNHLAFKWVDSDGKLTPSARYEAIKNLHREEDNEENKRLLYVALTRAKEQVYVPLHPNSRSNQLQKLLLEDLGENAQDFLSYENTEPYTEEASLTTKTNFPQHPSRTVDSQTIPIQALAPSEFSVSELETYAQCPLRHHYAYRQKLNEQSLQEKASLNPTQVGTLLHQALHQIHQQELESSKIPALLDELVQQQDASAEFEQMETLVQLLQDYLQEPIYQKIHQATESYSELPFLINLPQGRVRGQFDRLVRHAEDWSLIDFKYSHKSLSEIEVLHHYQFQLKTYALAVQKMLQGDIPQVEVHLLGVNKCIRLKYLPSQLEAHQEKLSQLMESIQKSDLTEVRFQEHCYQCPFYQKIPVCRVAALRAISGSTLPTLVD